MMEHYYAQPDKDGKIILIFTVESEPDFQIPEGCVRLDEHNPDYIGRSYLDFVTK